MPRSAGDLVVGQRAIVGAELQAQGEDTAPRRPARPVEVEDLGRAGVAAGLAHDLATAPAATSSATTTARSWRTAGKLVTSP